MTWDNLGINLLSNLIFSILAVGFAVVVSYISFRSKRVKRLRAIKLENYKNDFPLSIFTAHLVIKKGSALLHNDTPSAHFEGSAVPIREIEAAYQLKEGLDIGFFDHIPDSIRNWLVKRHKGYNKINFEILPSPLDITWDKDKRRMILIGGPEFNSLTDHFLKKTDLFTICDPPDCENPLIQRNVAGLIEEIKPDSVKYNLGLVQRLTFNKENQVVLLLVGIGTNGTLAAVHWFFKNWENIDKMFGQRDFGVVLECFKRSEKPEGYKDITVRKYYPEIAKGSKMI